MSSDSDVDVRAYCRVTKELYDRFCDAYITDRVKSVIEDQLECMQAKMISINGNIYFVPNQYLPMLNILEDYIETLSNYNLNNECTIVCNNMHVVDSERKSVKMTGEFYNNFKRDIEMYQKSIQGFIDNCGTRKEVID